VRENEYRAKPWTITSGNQKLVAPTSSSFSQNQPKWLFMSQSLRNCDAQINAVLDWQRIVDEIRR
jgi:hypothetical protein